MDKQRMLDILLNHLGYKCRGAKKILSTKQNVGHRQRKWQRDGKVLHHSTLSTHPAVLYGAFNHGRQNVMQPILAEDATPARFGSGLYNPYVAKA